MNALNQVIQLFLILGVGYYARKKNIVNSEVNRGLTSLLLNITFPLLIFNSFNIELDEKLMLNMLICFIFSTLIFGLVAFLSKYFYIKLPHGKRIIAASATVFSNCGFIGIPLIYGIFGDIGVIYAAIFNISYNLFMWTYGVMIFSGQKDLKSVKKLLTTPGIIAVAFGIVFMLFGLNLPEPAAMAVKMVGSMTSPLAMIIIGCMLAEVKLSNLFSDFTVYYISLIKLAVVPVITYGVLTAFRVDPVIKNVIVFCEAMPSGTLCGMMAENYNQDYKYASQTVFMTTLLSIITIPIVASLLK